MAEKFGTSVENVIQAVNALVAKDKMWVYPIADVKERNRRYGSKWLPEIAMSNDSGQMSSIASEVSFLIL